MNGIHQKAFRIICLLLCLGLMNMVSCEDDNGDNLSDGLKIFVTAQQHPGDFKYDPLLTGNTAMEKADNFCDIDPNKPNDSKYKALLVDGDLRDAVTLTDWVLQPNTTYYRRYDNIEIGTTSENAIFLAAYRHLTNSISDEDCTDYYVGDCDTWTGIDDHSTFAADDETCEGWSSLTAGGKVGTRCAVEQFAFGMCGTDCYAHKYIYCVEQP